jgi:DNA-binding transcriptional regulator YhcF (GntR family)
VKIWVSKNSEVPVHEQLVAQIALGIAAGDFKVGEKIPSTRELARRCGVHPNTVGSAYQKLVDLELLEFRQGSGFYVAESADEKNEGSRQLDRLIAELFDNAKSLGFDEQAVMKRLNDSTEPRPSGELLVVESDNGLREILLHELSSRIRQASGITFEDFSAGRFPPRVTLTAMLDEKPKIEPLLNGSTRCIYLRGSSVASAMSGRQRPGPHETVAVVSGWDGFLTFARIMLLAAKIDPGNLIVRSTGDEGWKDAAAKASIIICDSLTAGELDGSDLDRIREFRIISDESLDELTRLVTAS